MAIKLVIKVNRSGQGTVELDGTDLSKAVRAVEFRASARDEVFASLELCVDEIEITQLGSAEAEVLVNLPDDVINVLIQLGWTPPENDRRTYRYRMAEWVPADFPRLNDPPSAEEMEIIDRQSPDAND